MIVHGLDENRKWYGADSCCVPALFLWGTLVDTQLFSDPPCQVKYLEKKGHYDQVTSLELTGGKKTTTKVQGFEQFL